MTDKISEETKETKTIKDMRKYLYNLGGDHNDKNIMFRTGILEFPIDSTCYDEHGVYLESVLFDKFFNHMQDMLNNFLDSLYKNK